MTTPIRIDGRYKVVDKRTGEELPDGEYFVLRLQDLGTSGALREYADYYSKQDPGEYRAFVNDVRAMAARSGINHDKPKLVD